VWALNEKVIANSCETFLLTISVGTFLVGTFGVEVIGFCSAFAKAVLAMTYGVLTFVLSQRTMTRKMNSESSEWISEVNLMFFFSDILEEEYRCYYCYFPFSLWCDFKNKD
jgi:purine-cytosine permease-like protein